MSHLLFLFCSFLNLQSEIVLKQVPDQFTVLGPLSTVQMVESTGWTGVEMEQVLEIDVQSCLDLTSPTEGQKGLQADWKVQPGNFEFAAGVHWIALDLNVGRSMNARVDLVGPDKVAMFMEGEKRSLATESFLARGDYRVVFRIVMEKKGTIQLTAESQKSGVLKWQSVGMRSVSIFNQLHENKKITALAVSPDGEYYARGVSGYDELTGQTESEYALFDKSGKKLQYLPGKPLHFQGTRLFMLENGTRLNSLDLETMVSTTLISDEPDFNWLAMHPDSRGLLFMSSKHVSQDLPGLDAEHRHLHSRQTVPDYDVARVLWHYDLKSGIRRLVGLPGDRILDDACFNKDGSSIFYARTVPMQERPWFKSELRQFSLKTGSDHLLLSLKFGWEVRAFDLVYDPENHDLIYTGSPEEIGEGQAEHNVYNRQLWAFNTETGVNRRVSSKKAPSMNASNASGFPVLSSSGLFAAVDVGATSQFARIRRGKKHWAIEPVSTLGETLSMPVLSADGRYLLYQASSRHKMSFLAMTDLKTGTSQVLEEINRKQNGRFRFQKPVDASVKHPKGHQIDAWAYFPEHMKKGCPVVLYYYGGASPTSQSFNPTHQFFTANGYAVLVVNPRGAYGYGDAYADVHAGDWGPAASDDILHVLDTFLETNPQLDPNRIGIYGGSYGGFMTEYLVSLTDRFAAAVSLFGISDLSSYWGEGAWGWTYGDMALAGMTPYENPSFMVEHSPLFRADKIHTPLLLLHGEDDLNVRPEESIQLFTALERLKRPVELVLFPGEKHGISSTHESRSKHRTMILEWFDLYLKDQPESWQKRWEK